MIIFLAVTSVCFYLLGTFLIVFGRNWSMLAGILLVMVAPLKLWEVLLNFSESSGPYIIAGLAHIVISLACLFVGSKLRKRTGRGVPPVLRQLFGPSRPKSDE